MSLRRVFIIKLNQLLHRAFTALNKGQSPAQVRANFHYARSNPTHNLKGLNEGCVILLERDEVQLAKEVAEEILATADSGRVFHPVAITALRTAAVAFSRAGDNDRAVLVREQVHVLELAEHGEASNEVANARHELAQQLDRVKEYPRAIELERQVVAWWLAQGDTKRLALAEHQLGVLLARSGSYEEAKTAMSHALTLVNPDSKESQSVSEWLAYVAERTGDLEKALGLQQPTVELATRLFGPDDPRTLKSMENLANIRTRLDQREEACALLRSVLACRERTQGDDHPDTVRTREKLERFSSDP